MVGVRRIPLCKTFVRLEADGVGPEIKARKWWEIFVIYQIGVIEKTAAAIATKYASAANFDPLGEANLNRSFQRLAISANIGTFLLTAHKNICAIRTFSRLR